MGLVRRGRLTVPVVGLAHSGWTRDQLIERMKKSVTEAGVYDETTFAKLAVLLRYVDGDYAEPDTVARLKHALGNAKIPTHYLAIPPSMFPKVVTLLDK